MTAPSLADRHRERALLVLANNLYGDPSKNIIGKLLDGVAEALAEVERETIERATKVCEQEAREHAKLHDPHLEDVAYSCAELIRALADRKEG
jgi:hypothetical protein